jgi:hypothetical protein
VYQGESIAQMIHINSGGVGINAAPVARNGGGQKPKAQRRAIVARHVRNGFQQGDFLARGHSNDLTRPKGQRQDKTKKGRPTRHKAYLCC